MPVVIPWQSNFDTSLGDQIQVADRAKSLISRSFLPPRRQVLPPDAGNCPAFQSSPLHHDA